MNFALHPEKINKFILENYKTMSDVDIGLIVGLSAKTVYNRRYRMGIFLKKKINTPEVVAEILELFTTGITCAEIARILRKKPKAITDIINRHYFTKQRGYNTITLVLESKINYE